MDKEKLENEIAAVLFILKEMGGQTDFHKLFKIMYFADQDHIINYGRPIFYDDYIAMRNGPVPSHAYDLLKALNPINPSRISFQHLDQYFALEGSHVVRAREMPDMDCISKSEESSILKSIKDNSKLSFKELTNKSHDQAWSSVAENGRIPFIQLGYAAGASPEMIHYLEDHLASCKETYSKS